MEISDRSESLSSEINTDISESDDPILLKMIFQRAGT